MVFEEVGHDEVAGPHLPLLGFVGIDWFKNRVVQNPMDVRMPELHPMLSLLFGLG